MPHPVPRRAQATGLLFMAYDGISKVGKLDYFFFFYSQVRMGNLPLLKLAPSPRDASQHGGVLGPAGAQ